LAGVSTDSIERHRKWTSRLKLPYPLVSDPESRAGEALGIVRRIGLGTWRVELFRRTTLLVDIEGRIAAWWGKVSIRGHAAEVLRTARSARLAT